MEAVLILTTLAQGWRADALTDYVESRASITLRPRHGIPMRLRQCHRPT
jgi:hypothetical protein